MIDWTDVIVAFIALLGTALGTFYGIRKSNSLVDFRLKQLEEKVDKHNNLVERMTLVEHNVNHLAVVTDKLNDRVAVHGEQVDQVYTLAEKNESRIALLERLTNK